MIYFKSITAAFSQLLNAALAGNRDQSFSSRSFEGAIKGVKWCKVSRLLVDTLFFWEEDHCMKAFLSDDERTYK
jgi:hypothetical protein